jgi:hypothetical protein
LPIIQLTIIAYTVLKWTSPSRACEIMPYSLADLQTRPP